jgi:hypothetical protein
MRPLSKVEIAVMVARLTLTLTASSTVDSIWDLFDDLPVAHNDVTNDKFETTSNTDGQINEAENIDPEEPQQNLPLDFAFVSFTRRNKSDY